MKIGIFYGSTTSNTADLAEKLHEKLSDVADEPMDIADCSPEDLLQYDVLLLGCPTWNTGQLQDDWEDFAPQLGDLDFSGKKVTFFGPGDQNGYPTTFGDAFGLVWEVIEPKGAQNFAQWPTDGYDYAESKAVRNGKFIGLLVDEDNQSEMTDDRLDAWAQQVRSELGV